MPASCCPPILEVVVVGNGPSAISLSYMLSGNVPYYSGTSSDPLLDARLRQNPDETLLLQELKTLSEGLEGRSTKTVSLLFDALFHPDADLGLESPSLLSWEKRPDLKVSHLVIGRDEPGGAWRNMENDILTVSLGSWMELPNLPLSAVGGSTGNRVKVSLVAEYFRDYVQKMGLSSNFVNQAHVTNVRKIQLTNCVENENLQTVNGKDLDEMFRFSGEESSPPAAVAASSSLETIIQQRVCPNGLDVSQRFSSPASVNTTDSLVISSDGEEVKTRPFNVEEANDKFVLSCTPVGMLMIKQARKRASACCSLEVANVGCSTPVECCWNPIVNPSLFQATPLTATSTIPSNPQQDSTRACFGSSMGSDPVGKQRYIWEVRGFVEGENNRRAEFRYLARNVVLACGCDKSNSLDIPGEDLPFVLHSLKELEQRIAAGELNSTNKDPVMIVGAGLSAADAVITAMEHNLNIVHIFRRKADDKSLIFQNLPSRMYPEYHKIHRMMKGGRQAGYQPLEKQHLTEICPDRLVKFHGETTSEILKVSHVVVLIGASPNLEFLNSGSDGETRSEMLGILENAPVSKNNPMDINIYTFESVKHKGLYAMGPLVGDNFVRFLQGGALAIASDLLKRRMKFDQPYGKSDKD